MKRHILVAYFGGLIADELPMNCRLIVDYVPINAERVGGGNSVIAYLNHRSKLLKRDRNFGSSVMGVGEWPCGGHCGPSATFATARRSPDRA